MEDRGAWRAAVHGVAKNGIGIVPLSSAKFGGYRDEQDMPYHEELVRGERLECLRETGLILRCDRKVGNPFQTKQGSRPSRPDQEGRRGSEEVLPENFGVPLEGDRDVGALCGSHQG